MAAAAPALDPLFRADVVSQVEAIVEDANQSGARVAAWDQIVEVLKGAKLAWCTQVAPEMVGAHPLNRNFMGIGGSDAHWHGSQILKCGFSWVKASDATCLEIPPAPLDADAKTANEKLVDLSSGQIPALAQLRYLSIGGGHTNVFLRAVKSKWRTCRMREAD